MGKNLDKLVGQVVASGALSKAERARRKQQAVEARRALCRKEREQLRRQEREQLRLAAAAEIWDDRDGKARPTRQRRLKGVFSLRDGDEAGVAVAVDVASCTIDVLAHDGRITARQREAGHVFEEVARGGMGSPSGRSCCDMTPAGHEGDEEDEEVTRARRRWDSLRRMVSPVQRAELLAVCWQYTAPRSMDRLRLALDAVADWAALDK